ncbi:TonB-dependent receptor domain-containing protein [Peristeroidobacter soli]|uniref:TonB-dependent receptor domain-containing protein n=1 Tax=Peristeroidobacter soli TaxID=2497877 RepID=UPI001588C1D8|nr:TonB-dependent receptor [Peristeroidobacter soli]
MSSRKQSNNNSIARCLRKTLVAAALGALLSQNAVAEEPRQRVDIPAQPVVDALNAFSRESGLRLLFPYDAVENKQIRAIQGELTRQEVLDRLLIEAGLIIASRDGNVVTLRVADLRPTAIVVEEVIVTATHREQSLSEVPIATTALTQDDLTRAGATRVQDVVRYSPGFSMTSAGANRERIAVRGISTSQGQFLQQATVGQFIDEIVTDSGAGSSTTLDSRLFDVARVELLRGPQGTLFGSGSLSGALRVITNKPDLEAFHVTTEARGESIEDGELGGGVSGMLNVPLVQGRLGLRAVAYAHNEGGYVDNARLGQEDVNSEHVRGGRLIVAAQPVDRLSLQATLLYQNSKTFGGFASVVTPGLGAPVEEYKSIQSVNSRNELEFSAANFVGQVDLGFASLLSSTSYSEREFTLTDDGTPYLTAISRLLGVPGGLTTPTPALTPSSTHQFSQELRLASTGEQVLDWTVGAIYIDRDTRGGQWVVAPALTALVGSPNLYALDVQSSQSEQALFGELSWDITSRFTATAGLRASRTSIGFDTIAAGYLATGSFTRVNTFSGDKDVDTVTPRFALSYAFSDSARMYAQAAKGFRTGGPNATASTLLGIPSTYEPDSLWNYELGLKSHWLDRRIAFNAALYYIDWQDLQLGLARSGVAYTGNAGAAESYGVEIEAVWRMTSRWTLGSALFGGHAEVTEDVPTLTRPGGALGVRSGERLPATPEFTSTTYLEFRPTAATTVRAEHGYVGASYVDFASSGPKLGDYHLVNLRGTLRLSAIDLMLYVDNLLNEDGRTTATLASSLAGQLLFPATAVQLRPRTVGFEARYEF